MAITQRLSLLLFFAGSAACANRNTIPEENRCGGVMEDTEPKTTPCGSEARYHDIQLVVRSAKCDYYVGEPATFDYEVTITKEMLPLRLEKSSGGCFRPNGDALSWLRIQIEGRSRNGEMLYCPLCDTGLCAPMEAQTIQLAPQTKKGTLHWSGRNWRGPSDTSNPEDAFFDPGSYELRLRFDGGPDKQVTAPLRIRIFARKETAQL